MINVQHIDHMGNDERVVAAARISFAVVSEGFTERDEKLIAYLAAHQHMTPFEHCTLSVRIECPIYISKQIMRHRSFAFNEVSRRYTDKDLHIYAPSTLREQHKNNKQGSKGVHPQSDAWLARLDVVNQLSLKLFNEMVADGVCKEQARGILPQNTMTSFYMTGNLRNWAHFIKLRKDPHAQLEVQYVAAPIEKILNTYFPISTKYLLGDCP